MPDDELGIIVRLKEVAKAVADSERVKRAISSIGDATKKSNKDLSAMSATGLSSFSGITRGVQSAASSLMTYTRYAGLGAAAATGFGLKSAAGLEQSNVAISRLMGSQEKATRFITQIQDFAETSPFQFTDAMRNAQQLLAKGFNADEAVNALRAIGDAASGVGAGQEGVDGISRAVGQMRMKAKLSAEEINGQLAEWGINGWKYLAEAAGKTINQVQIDAQNGLIGGAQASDVILRGMQKEFGGMMEAQSRTLGGRWSNLIDHVKRKLYSKDAQGKEGGIMFPLMQLLRDNILPNATRLTDKIMPKAEAGMARFVGSLRYLGRGYQIGGMEGLVESLGNLLGIGDRLVPVWRHIRDDSKSLGNVWTNSLWPAIRNVASVLAPFAGGTLKVLEGVLHWMEDHPDAAAAIFTGLGIALAEWAIVSTLGTIATTIGTIGKGFWAAQAGVLAFTGATKGLSMLTGIGAGAPMIGGAGGALSGAGGPAGAGAAGGLSGAGAGLAATGGAGTVAAVGGGALLGGVALGVLGSKIKDSVKTLAKGGGASFGFKKFAGGGTQSVTGMATVGEQGPELVRLPGGSQVTNNKQLMSALSANQKPQVVFAEGAINISGTDVLNNQRVADILLQQLNDRIARG